MLKQGSGQIVNITSVGAKAAFALGSYYYASKHALKGLMQSLRLEVSKCKWNNLYRVPVSYTYLAGLLCTYLSSL